MAKPLANLLSVLTPKRRWAQFSLASMFVVVTVLCVWLGAVVNRANRQREAVAAIEALGGEVRYERSPKNADTYFTRLLRGRLPRDFTDDVAYVRIPWSNDSDLDRLRPFKRLRELRLEGTGITEAGLGQLRAFNGLRALSVGRTPLTETGLNHLRALTGLERLTLLYTKASRVQIAELQDALPKCRFDGAFALPDNRD
jgi:hypothetical protein